MRAMEPASSRAEDEHLDWLKSVLHQVDGLAGTVLQAHLMKARPSRIWLRP